MKTFIALLLFAACGYGAYTHIESLETRINATNEETDKAKREQTAIKAEMTTLEAQLRTETEKAEAEKAKAAAKVSADIAADIAKRKAEQEEQIRQLITPVDSTALTETKLKIAELQAATERLQASLAKPLAFNATLKGYVRTEESRGKAKFTPSTSR